MFKYKSIFLGVSFQHILDFTGNLPVNTSFLPASHISRDGLCFAQKHKNRDPASRELSLTTLSSCCLSFGSMEGPGRGSTSTSGNCSWLLPKHLHRPEKQLCHS